MLVKQFCEERIDGFSPLFYDSLPQECPEVNCGFPMSMNETLTHLHCSNPRCPAKLVQRLNAITKQLGVKDFGEARIKSFVNQWCYDLANPLLIFAFEPEEDGTLGEDISMELTEKIIGQFKKKKKFTLAEYVRIANLPNVQTSASSVFGDYDDLNKAYEDIETGGVPFIEKKLGLIGDGSSVRGLLVYKSLMEFKEDLFDFIDDVEIIKTHQEDAINLRAVVSDEVGSGFKTKAEFYATCNDLYPNIHIEFLGAVNKTINYLIWAGADGSPARMTNKYQKVSKYNMQYTDKVNSGKLKDGDHFIHILTASQFIEELHRIAKEGV